MYFPLVVILSFTAVVKCALTISKNIHSTVPQYGRAYMALMIPCTRTNVILRECQQIRHLLSTQISWKRKVFYAVAEKVL
jgi:hypothetical protein